MLTVAPGVRGGSDFQSYCRGEQGNFRGRAPRGYIEISFPDIRVLAELGT